MFGLMIPPNGDGPRLENARDHVVDVVRADGVALGVAPGRAHGSATRARVAVRERREDPGRDPGLHDRLVEGVAAVVVAPRVVDDVRPHVRLRVLAVEVGRRQHPLAGRQQRVRRAAVGLATLGRDPLRVRGDADLVRPGSPSSPTIVPIVCVPWPLLSHGVRARAHGRRVKPVVVVVEGAAAVVAAVLRDERVWV